MKKRYAKGLTGVRFFRWYRVKETRMEPILDGEDGFSLLHGHLVMEKVRPEDQGDYVCLVKNTLGSRTLEVKLKIQGKFFYSLLGSTRGK